MNEREGCSSSEVQYLTRRWQNLTALANSVTKTFQVGGHCRDMQRCSAAAGDSQSRWAPSAPPKGVAASEWEKWQKGTLREQLKKQPKRGASSGKKFVFMIIKMCAQESSGGSTLGPYPACVHCIRSMPAAYNNRLFLLRAHRDGGSGEDLRICQLAQAKEMWQVLCGPDQDGGHRNRNNSHQLQTGARLLCALCQGTNSGTWIVSFLHVRKTKGFLKYWKQKEKWKAFVLSCLAIREDAANLISACLLS